MNAQSTQILGNDVHVWKIDVDSVSFRPIHTGILSDDEVKRSKKYRFKIDRDTFIAGRVALRFLIAEYINANPEEICFDHNAQGKPSVNNSAGLEFNLSNSYGKIVIALCINDIIGVDIEQNTRPVEIQNIAKSFFSQPEIETLEKISDENKLIAFYNCWTRKEAYIKALGGGLSIPLDQFGVSLAPSSKAEILFIEGNSTEPSQWSLVSFDFEHEFTGAIAVRKQEINIRFFHFDLGKTLVEFTNKMG
ncbi:MAG: 4'-phosphopantetheinyl transferase [Cyclobacteriaceae bacterium]|jgi:4'-phosphopantetheinyl transferase